MKHPGQIQPDRYDAGYNPGYAYTNMDLLEDATLYLAIAFAIAWAVLYIKERVSMENKGFEQIAKKARAPYLANPEKYHAPSKRMNKYVQAILITTVVCICMYGILFGLFAWLAWHLNEPNGTKILTDLGWRLWAIMGGLWCFLIFTAVMTAKYDHYFDEPIELVTIQRYAVHRRAGFLKARRLAFVLAIRVVFSDEEYSAIRQRNLYDLPVMDRPFHPLWCKSEEEWKEIQALPVGLLVHLHETGRSMEIAYYNNDFDAESGERQLRRGLETLKAVITGSKATDRTEEFEI